MFPTRHWRVISGTIVAGGQATVAHGLRNGATGTAVTPDVLVDIVESSGVLGRGSTSIIPYQAFDATNVYLSNWDPAIVRGYHMLVRNYHSIDDQNF